MDQSQITFHSNLAAVYYEMNNTEKVNKINYINYELHVVCYLPSLIIILSTVAVR